MRIFARITRCVVVQRVQLPDGLPPIAIYPPSMAATFVDVTEKDPTPQIGWASYPDGSFGPPAPLVRDLSADEARSRATALIYSCDPVIEHFYEHFLPVPEEWAEYRAALRRIAATGRLPSDAGPEQPAFPAFSFRRDALQTATPLVIAESHLAA